MKRALPRTASQSDDSSRLTSGCSARGWTGQTIPAARASRTTLTPLTVAVPLTRTSPAQSAVPAGALTMSVALRTLRVERLRRAGHAGRQPLDGQLDVADAVAGALGQHGEAALAPGGERGRVGDGVGRAHRHEAEVGLLAGDADAVGVARAEQRVAGPAGDEQLVLAVGGHDEAVGRAGLRCG